MPTDLESDLSSLTSTKEDDDSNGSFECQAIGEIVDGSRASRLEIKVPKSFGREMDPEAPIWKLYKKASKYQDDHILRTWNNSIDALLIFAALFSAVVTAFVVESYKLMQPDYMEMTFKLLASNMTRPIDDVPFQVSSSARTVNCLWITSLVFSLSTSLVGIMIKHWLADYEAVVQEQSMEWCAARQMRYNNLLRWRLPDVVAWLPILLHASLLLFLAGLALFLLPIDVCTAAWGLALSILVCVSYSAATLLPVFYRSSPYGTPVTAHLAYLLDHCRSFVMSLRPSVLDGLPSNSRRPSSHEQALVCALQWLIDTGPSTMSDKIYVEVQRALCDLRRGPELCRLLPFVADSMVDYMPSFSVLPGPPRITQYLDIAFRLNFNRAALLYPHPTRPSATVDLASWYAHRYRRGMIYPAWAVAICYLRERSRHEESYHRIRVDENELPVHIAEQLVVSPETVHYIIKAFSGRFIDWDVAPYSVDHLRLRDGIRTILTLVSVWSAHYAWDDQDVGLLLFLWLPSEDRTRDFIRGPIPLLCRVLMCQHPRLREELSLMNVVMPYTVLDTILHLCLARSRAQDESPGLIQYRDLEDLFGPADRRSEVPTVFDPEIQARITPEQLIALLDATDFRSDSRCVWIIRDLLRLDMCGHSPELRDKCAALALQHINDFRDEVIDEFLYTQALAPLRDHSLISDIMLELMKALLKLQRTSLYDSLPWFNACLDSMRPGELVLTSDWVAPRVIATMITQAYKLTGDNSWYLKDVCQTFSSLVEKGYFFDDGKWVMRHLWASCRNYEIASIAAYGHDQGGATTNDWILGNLLATMERLDMEREEPYGFMATCQRTQGTHVLRSAYQWAQSTRLSVPHVTTTQTSWSKRQRHHTAAPFKTRPLPPTPILLREQAGRPALEQPLPSQCRLLIDTTGRPVFR